MKKNELGKGRVIAAIIISIAFIMISLSINAIKTLANVPTSQEENEEYYDEIVSEDEPSFEETQIPEKVTSANITSELLSGYIDKAEELLEFSYGNSAGDNNLSYEHLNTYVVKDEADNAISNIILVYKVDYESLDGMTTEYLPMYSYSIENEDALNDPDVYVPQTSDTYYSEQEVVQFIKDDPEFAGKSIDEM